MSSRWAAMYAERGLQTPTNPHAIPPVRANSVVQFDAETVKSDAAQARLLVHHRFPQLIDRFLNYKRQHGSATEKRVYANMTAGQEIARLFRNRPLAFLDGTDTTKLRDGRVIHSAAHLWDAVGTDREGIITLDEYLSYEEIMLSSFIGCSGPSFFINDGNRHNSAHPGYPGTFEERGVIVGLVGARFERLEHMDANIVLTKHKEDSEVTKMILDFLQVQKLEGSGFDENVYIARMKIPILLLLSEAQWRAQAESKKAYLYVVGLGLGVWQHDSSQPEYYIRAWCQILKEYKGNFPNIGIIEFAYINVTPMYQGVLKDIAKRDGIEVRFTKRAPAAKLKGMESEHLLVLSYAWDANSYPGNEYWMGHLSASGDPAAASMSTIAEIHNPEINPRIWQSYENPS
ncbi:hypothetical protein F4821DRAFT_144996 [Hypoxylon rubiginosum]|uniref:Uncharacterized protein n=1 Tax=Hypoxylon rubiginosum TaxID=110542 RepID=A0ACC0CZ36_9PEZI|nr:hypothetical protein F4821DRAFT_144996 [Hypoxylon rubiginosum]